MAFRIRVEHYMDTLGLVNQKSTTPEAQDCHRGREIILVHLQAPMVPVSTENE